MAEPTAAAVNPPGVVLRPKEMPVVLQLALGVLLRHVEPGWENCAAVLRAWLDGSLAEIGLVAPPPKEEKVDG